MFLLESGRFAADPDGMSKSITGMIEKAGGTLVAHRPWQDGRLAYPINGQRKGLHYLAYFRMPGTGLKDLNRACRLNDQVLRHLIIKIGLRSRRSPTKSRPAGRAAAKSNATTTRETRTTTTPETVAGVHLFRRAARRG